MTRLTDPQRRALLYLSGVHHATASELGCGMDDGSYKKHLTAQGAGRIGGVMAWRLRSAGLVKSVDRGGGWSAYAITDAGRTALANQGGAG